MAVDLLSERRPRVNASELPKFRGKLVTFVGNVDIGKTSSDGTSFTLTDGEGKSANVLLNSPLSEITDGTVEITGTVTPDCNIQATMYNKFSSSCPFDMELYNATIKITREFQHYFIPSNKGI